MRSKGKRSSGGWKERPDKSIARRAATREQSPTILIVCAGSKTEPNYLHDIRRELNLTAMHIVGGNVCGTNPKSITDFTKAEYKSMLDRKIKIDKQNVWCVFDRDDHDYISNAIVMANANGFNVCFSNQCFELWFLLHFQDQTAWIERGEVVRKLKKHIRDYEKSMDGIFALIKDKRSVAEKRAIALRKKHTGDGNDITHNPSTTTDLLVSFLYKAANK